MSDLKRTKMSVTEEKAILVGVLLPESNADPRDPLGELASLATTAGAREVGRILQRRQRPDPGTFCGTGKAEEIAALAIRNEADVVLFDNDLSPAQIGKLEKIINTKAKSPVNKGIKVLDRSELILDIFATRAQTHEAKLQVELAQMQYTYPRLTRMWGHLERIASGASSGMGLGTRGPGETQLEVDRRLVRDRISELRRDIERIQERKGREVEARNRQHFTVCIVGYTNAGKSTLFNTLTGAETYADDKLFATLDTKTRAWKLERGTDVMLSDTVGFVRDLPHHLVASFRATLEEAVNADLLLHVLDVGHPRARQQYESVHEVLTEIGAGGRPEVLLLNKVDTREGAAAYPEWRALMPGAVAVSAKTGEGLTQVAEIVLGHVRGTQRRVRVECETSDGKLIAFVRQHSTVLEESFDDRKAVLTTMMGQYTLQSLQKHPHATVTVAN